MFFLLFLLLISLLVKYIFITSVLTHSQSKDHQFKSPPFRGGAKFMELVLCHQICEYYDLDVI